MSVVNGRSTATKPATRSSKPEPKLSFKPPRHILAPPESSGDESSRSNNPDSNESDPFDDVPAKRRKIDHKAVNGSRLANDSTGVDVKREVDDSDPFSGFSSSQKRGKRYGNQKGYRSSQEKGSLADAPTVTIEKNNQASIFSIAISKF